MISFDDKAWDQYIYWQDQDRKTLKRLNKLIRDIQRHPFEGLGKPEPLRNDLSGYWSRRIDGKNRLVYRVAPDQIVIMQCRFHYGD